MITANELRIGNWVIGANKELFQIDGYGIANVEAFQCDIEPIPLTPEILEKCGFEDISDKKGVIDPITKEEFKEDWIRFVIGLEYTPEGAYKCKMELELDEEGWYVDHHYVYVKYLHQLQNLYFALTGTELALTSPTPLKD